MNTIWLLALVVGVSFLGTGALRKYALARSLIDIPNARSSHSVPTPRGGGVAIVVSFLIALPVLAWTDAVAWPMALALLGAGGWIAIVGFLDDHGHIAARWRLLAHFGGAIWALFWIGGMAPINLFGHEFSLGWFGYVIAAFYLVWMLNLYNFMDGIDGLASVEAICACVGACLVYWIAGHNSLAIAPLVLAMAVLGFLVWNFPPAKIFMGDAGSGFLGIILAVMSLYAAWTNPLFLWAWLILLGVFIVDATFTLIRRLLRGDKVYEAHRSHGYQYASRKYGSHRAVTLAIAAINLLWLVPVAILVVMQYLDGVAGLVLAYVPMVLLAFKFHAGELEIAGKA
ncbi:MULTISPECIES: MraY family glycosyltransferase [Pseudomonas]|uniref:MraY family glycosyltransferase n=1 Tax=Pseudomonas TaxID=286 RepID=UPI001251259F|nr:MULTISPECIES: glycosyltransferase family 4 protein [Pseudomonas]MBV7524224.1 glycosyltransferase family 4 protein [Pseudomonas sp. PDM29]VVP54185.1 putative undecaprenyl-phosphate N-acetylglucosaminyl 1-phosphate transferase [Pseudomonas fluorescens]